MNQYQRYLAEEVAVDHADGLITRRDALQRLALLGVNAAAAASLLAAFPAQAPAARPQAPAVEPLAGAAPVPARSITFRGPQGRTLMAAWAPAARPRGGVLVIHENKGLTPHIRSVAGRFAASGYSALAVDLLSEEGGTGSFGSPDEATAALGAVPESRFAADLKASVTELGRRVSGKKLAATGFCFGGGMVWFLLASREARLAAAAPFYGPFPDNGKLTGSKAAVLGIYAELDARVNGSRPAASAALKAAKLKHSIVTFPGVDHAFFNSTGPRYDRAAATQAYQRVIDWFDRHVATA